MRAVNTCRGRRGEGTSSRVSGITSGGTGVWYTTSAEVGISTGYWGGVDHGIS